MTRDAVLEEGPHPALSRRTGRGNSRALSKRWHNRQSAPPLPFPPSRRTNHPAMARLRDIPPVLRKVGIFRFFKNVWFQIGEDQVFTWASALAYSWLFAIFPFLLFLLTLVPYLPEAWKSDTKHWIAVAVYSLPKEAADTMWENLWPHIDRFLQAKASSVSIISVLLTLWGASGGVATTMAALDKCYEVEKSRPFYKQRLLMAPAVTFIEVSLILAVMVLIPIGTLLTRWGEQK